MSEKYCPKSIPRLINMQKKHQKVSLLVANIYTSA